MIRERGECGKRRALDNAALEKAGTKSLIVQDPRSVDMVRGGLNPLLLASLDTLLNVGGVVAIPWKPLARRHVELKVSQICKKGHFGFL